MTTTPEPIAPPTPLERFLSTLHIVHREGAHRRLDLPAEWLPPALKIKI
ncbi:hypothetical protein Tfont_00442 [Tepidimonas fonticaldi]|uniref:Uncharacterized protein n=1 Tax=Tepidimonas fonticaldi TaxID=1101373 RepID=A0A554XPQ4_9BURK|nr:hypothetical protein [Tepidimonas fonticaldi]TSE37790.1 hypothetical protein Tfont_00442 [Tepidimonas fonticaldi]